ncbi:nitrogenase cofactor biosynthesis protein NifB [Vibrio maritimus]|uniref:nitrogenase cofactor biosynthesis protein NifB n=1 Tax=Vibrio maritimus TaxID=990268 RepID=UPI0037363ABD
MSHFFRKDIQDKIEQHPCYSKNAHQYARIHLPVAPACNIQCHYCNRKYDCSNESRPGVVSHLVDPHGAFKRYQAVASRSPNLSVVGIAGPGDALANPAATFKTLELVRQHNPQVQLCISTNGLALVDYIEPLLAAGVNHLTITINCVDPHIGAKIYPWIYFDHRRLRGVEAASTLIKRQLEGLEAAAQAGMLVKVNTVLIPGINDSHIEAVAEKVSQLGAMLHNIMPLISEPKHGTYFGITGQSGPNEQQLDRARQDSAKHIAQMTHCQQCRADAVGTLGEPCSQAETIEALPTAHYRVAIAHQSPSIENVIQTHFGYADRFDVYAFDVKRAQFIFEETRIASKYCRGRNDCNDNEEYKSLLMETIKDCQTILCSRIGITPWQQLERLGITPNIDFAFTKVETALSKLALTVDLDIQTEVIHEEIRHYG